MSKTVDLFVLEYDDRDDCDVYTKDMLVAAGLPTDETTPEHFGNAGTWRSITLAKAIGGMKSDIRRKCLMPDDVRGFIFDDTKWDAAACEVVVNSWTGFGKDEPTAVAYNALPLALADIITQIVNAHLNPSSLNNPFFTAAWRAKQKPPEAKGLPVPDGSTSILA